jgi:hypothetical protein
MRDEYLFTLARLCHLAADQIDRLTLRDFANYTDSADAYLKALEKAGKG